jgi:uncharacterized protein (TIGR02145 family)
MKNLRFLSFYLLLTLGLVNSYGQNDNSPKETTDPAYHDEGVVINGVKWATRNIAAPGTFAANPEDAGMFYQWNRNVGWSETNPIINSNGRTASAWNTSNPKGATWVKANDPSPAGWRVPTFNELKTLLDTAKVNREWTTQSNVNGCRFTDKATGKSIFLPAAGVRSDNDGTLFGTGAGGGYWSSVAKRKGSAYHLCLCHKDAYWRPLLRKQGQSVRCVAE